MFQRTGEQAPPPIVPPLPIDEEKQGEDKMETKKSLLGKQNLSLLKSYIISLYNEQMSLFLNNI